MDPVGIESLNLPLGPLLLGVLACILSRWLRQNSPLGDYYHVFTREFLLQFSDNPSLNLLEGLELRVRDPDDDSLLAADCDLLCATNLQLPELWLEVG